MSVCAKHQPVGINNPARAGRAAGPCRCWCCGRVFFSRYRRQHHRARSRASCCATSQLGAGKRAGEWERGRGRTKAAQWRKKQRTRSAYAWASRRPIEEVCRRRGIPIACGPYAQSICRGASSSHRLPLVHGPLLFSAAMLKTGTRNLLLLPASSSGRLFFASLCLPTKGHNILSPPTSFRRDRRSAEAAWRPRSRWDTTWSACETRRGSSSPF